MTKWICKNCGTKPCNLHVPGRNNWIPTECVFGLKVENGFGRLEPKQTNWLTVVHP